MDFTPTSVLLIVLQYELVKAYRVFSHVISLVISSTHIKHNVLLCSLSTSNDSVGKAVQRLKFSNHYYYIENKLISHLQNLGL